MQIASDIYVPSVKLLSDNYLYFLFNFKAEDVTLFCSFSSNENMSYIILVVFLYY